MAYFEFLWTDEIIEHLALHGVTPEEFEEIVKYPEARGNSRTTGRPCCWGETADGRYVICVYENLGVVQIRPYSGNRRAPNKGQFG